jgi:hypothetical protein
LLHSPAMKSPENQSKRHDIEVDFACNHKSKRFLTRRELKARHFCDGNQRAH